jgi:uncharacterized protein (TIGR00369 family)
VRDEDKALERVRASFALQGFMEHLGAEMIDVAPGRVVIRLPFQQELTQQDGYFHAGATSAIADSAGGYAALTVFPMESAVLTIEFKINLLAPATGGHLEAIGSVVRSGRTLTVCKLEVFALTGAERTLIAIGQQTLICLPASRDSR